MPNGPVKCGGKNRSADESRFDAKSHSRPATKFAFALRPRKKVFSPCPIIELNHVSHHAEGGDVTEKQIQSSLCLCAGESFILLRRVTISRHRASAAAHSQRIYDLLKENRQIFSRSLSHLNAERQLRNSFHQSNRKIFELCAS